MLDVVGVSSGRQASRRLQFGPPKQKYSISVTHRRPCEVNARLFADYVAVTAGARRVLRTISEIAIA